MFSLARDLGVKGFGESYYQGSKVSIDQAGTGKGLRPGQLFEWARRERDAFVNIILAMASHEPHAPAGEDIAAPSVCWSLWRVDFGLADDL